MSSTAAASTLQDSRPRLARFLYASVILTSAFLLFQVQFIAAKNILPWFGGTASVWTTCLLFFQVLLLAGYAYAHLLSIRLRPANQMRIHISLIVLSVAMLL